MSRLTCSNKHHTNIRNNTSDIISTKPSSDEKNRSHLDTTIKEVKQEFRSHHQQLLVKRKELITRLGKVFESILSNPKDVCEEIKNSLQEEIVDKIISKRDIERYCPDKWKKNTKPKNDNLSFSKQSEKSQHQIAATQGSKSVIINETSSDGINQLHDQTKQNVTDADDNDEADAVNQDKSVSYNEAKANTESSTIVQKLQSHPSDKEQYVFTIPRGKYGIVIDAMDNSKASIFVKFDRNKNFLGADPDVVPNRQNRNVQQIQSDGIAKDEALGNFWYNEWGMMKDKTGNFFDYAHTLFNQEFPSNIATKYDQE